MERDKFNTPGEVIDAVYSAVTANPERFEMGAWARRRNEGNMCTTVLCMAGWACVLNGGNPVFNDHTDATLVTYSDGTEVHIADEAARLLGISNVYDSPFFMNEESALAWLEERTTIHA